MFGGSCNLRMGRPWRWRADVGMVTKLDAFAGKVRVCCHSRGPEIPPTPDTSNGPSPRGRAPNEERVHQSRTASRAEIGGASSPGRIRWHRDRHHTLDYTKRLGKRVSILSGEAVPPSHPRSKPPTGMDTTVLGHGRHMHHPASPDAPSGTDQSRINQSGTPTNWSHRPIVHNDQPGTPAIRAHRQTYDGRLRHR